MAWTTPRTWNDRDIVTHDDLNEQLKDNLLESVPAKATKAGQLFYSIGANTIRALDPPPSNIPNPVFVFANGAYQWHDIEALLQGVTIEIADDSVTADKLDVIADPQGGNYLTWNDTQNKFQWVSAPSFTLGENSVTSRELAANAIQDEHIVDGTISVSKLKVDGTYGDGFLLGYAQNDDAIRPIDPATLGGSGGLSLPQVQEAIEAELVGYYTSAQTDNAISTAISNIPPAQGGSGISQSDLDDALDDYDLSTVVDSKITNANNNLVLTAGPVDLLSNNSPSVGDVPTYVDDNNFHWEAPATGGGSGGSTVLNTTRIVDTLFDSRSTGSGNSKRTLDFTFPYSDVNEDDIYLWTFYQPYDAVTSSRIDHNDYRNFIESDGTTSDLVSRQERLGSFILTGRAILSLQDDSDIAGQIASAQTDFFHFYLHDPGRPDIQVLFYFGIRKSDGRVRMHTQNSLEPRAAGIVIEKISSAEMDDMMSGGLTMEQVVALIAQNSLDKSDVQDITTALFEGETTQSYPDLTFAQTTYRGNDNDNSADYTTQKIFSITEAGRLSIKIIPNVGTIDNRPIDVHASIVTGNENIKHQIDFRNPSTLHLEIDSAGEVLVIFDITKHGRHENFTQLGFTVTDITVSQGGELISTVQDITRPIVHEIVDPILQDVSELQDDVVNNRESIIENNALIHDRVARTDIENLDVINQVYDEDVIVIDETVTYITPDQSNNSEIITASSGQFFKNRPNFRSHPEDSDGDDLVGNVAQIVNEIDGSTVEAASGQTEIAFPIKTSQFDGSMENGLEISTSGLLTGPGISGDSFIINLADSANSNILMGFRFASINNTNGSLISFKDRETGNWFDLATIENRRLHTFGYSAGTSEEVTYRQALHSQGVYTRTYHETQNRLEAYEWEVPESGAWTVSAHFLVNGNDDGTSNITVTLPNLTSYHEGHANFVSASGQVIPVTWQFRPKILSANGRDELGILMRPNTGLEINRITVGIYRDQTKTVVTRGNVVKSQARYTFEAGKQYYAVTHKNPSSTKDRWNVRIYNLTDGTSDLIANSGIDYGTETVDYGQIRVGGSSIAYQDIAITQGQVVYDDAHGILSTLTAENFNKANYMFGYIDKRANHSIRRHGVDNALAHLNTRQQARTEILSIENAKDKQIKIVTLPPPETYSEVYAIVDDRTVARTQREIRLSSTLLASITERSGARIEANELIMHYETNEFFDSSVDITRPNRSLSLDPVDNVSFVYVEVIE